MSEFLPVTTVSDLAQLDAEDVGAGYMAGLEGDPEPGSDKSRSFWHGYRNGMCDSGRRSVDDAQRQLVRAVVVADPMRMTNAGHC